MTIKDIIKSFTSSYEADTNVTEDTPSILEDADYNADPEAIAYAQQIAAELQEALKHGPVKVTNSDGSDEEVHVPETWTGAMSGLPFAAQMSMTGMMMTFSIPNTIPVTLMVAVKDEFALFETAQSVDFGMAVAADPTQIPMPTIGANAIRLAWLLGFLREATQRVRANLETPNPESTVAMVVHGNNPKAGRERAETMLRTLDGICSRLETALKPFNKDGLMTRMVDLHHNSSVH